MLLYCLSFGTAALLTSHFKKDAQLVTQKVIKPTFETRRQACGEECKNCTKMCFNFQDNLKKKKLLKSINTCVKLVAL